MYIIQSKNSLGVFAHNLAPTSILPSFGFLTSMIVLLKKKLISHDGRLVDDLKGEAASRNGKLLSRAASSRSSRWSPGSEVAPLRWTWMMMVMGIDLTWIIDTCIICGNLRESNKLQFYKFIMIVDHHHCHLSHSRTHLPTCPKFCGRRRILIPSSLRIRWRTSKTPRERIWSVRWWYWKQGCLYRNGGNWVRSNIIHLFCIKQRSILTLDPNNVM